MQVIWPDGTVTKLRQPEADRLHELDQKDASSEPLVVAANNSTWLSTLLLSSWQKPQEDSFEDFYYERNLPMMLSREGPAVACADVNADGLTDVYVGGAKGQSGTLYLQQKKWFLARRITGAVQALC